jgi:hypothetical protein
MKYSVRNSDGILLGVFTGLAADNLMTAIHTEGHWRNYKTNDLATPIQVFEIDTDLVVGEDRGGVGSMKIYLWAGTIVIPH